MPDLAALQLQREWDAHRALLADIGAVLVRHCATPPLAIKEEVTSKRRGRMWVNVYENAAGEAYLGIVCQTLEYAEMCARQRVDRRIACVNVTWTEGEGL